MAKYKQHIPTGDNKDDVYIRRAIIVEHLYPLKGKSVPCKAFKNNRVEFNFNSIDETATRASQRYESTMAALRIVEALRKAILVKTDEPHSTKQRKMKFVKMHELKSELKGIGEVKIMVGERSRRQYIHYCITQKNNR